MNHANAHPLMPTEFPEFFSKKEYNCEDATFASILDRKGRFEIDLQLTRSLGSSCDFFNERLNYSQFKGFGDIPY